MNIGRFYVVAVFSEEPTERGCVMLIPRNCVFREDIAHNTFIIFVVRGAVVSAIVEQRRVVVSVTITIVAIPGAVGWIRIVGRIRILRVIVGCLWVVVPVPAPQRTPWKAEVANNDNFVEMMEATKPVISIKVAVVGTIKLSSA